MPRQFSEEHEQQALRSTASGRDQRPAVNPLQRGTAGRLLALQRAVGNRAVQRSIAARVTIAPAGTALEQQADQVAEALSDTEREPESTDERISTHAGAGSRAGADDDSQARRSAPPMPPVAAATVQRAADSDIEAAVDDGFVQQLDASHGSALPDRTRQTMEQHFGRDFRAVRVHTDRHAAELSDSIAARAFTTGENIFFGQGEYQPQAASGRRLLAHELTHVVQQGSAAPTQLHLNRKKNKSGRRRKHNRRRQAEQPQAAAPAEEQQGWLSWGMSKLGGLAGMVGYSGETEEEHELSYEPASGTHGDLEVEEDEGGASVDDFVTIKTIKIKLVDKDDAKFESGALKGNVGAEVSSEGLSGKAELQVELWNSEAKRKVFDWDVAGGKLKGDDTMEGFAGVKAEVEASGSIGRDEGSMLPSSVSARAKAKAFAGFSAERSVAISIVGAEDRKLVSATGKLGFSVGVGGEYSGTLVWQGGRLQIGGKAKASLGIGGSFGFELEIDPLNVGRSFFSYLGSWASWAYSKL